MQKNTTYLAVASALATLIRRVLCFACGSDWDMSASLAIDSLCVCRVFVAVLSDMILSATVPCSGDFSGPVEPAGKEDINALYSLNSFRNS